ncbi:MAG: hypothetical protein ACJ73S_13905 [Mycobacteriales bacterium]
MARNIRKPGTSDLTESLESALRACLSEDWALHRVQVGPATAPDMIIRLQAPDGTATTLVIEAKKTIEPRDVPACARQLDHLRRASGAEAGMAVSPYISPLARKRLAEAGIGWYDATGNLGLRLARPAVFIERTGQSRSPFTEPDDRRLRSLKGPAAARVVRSLLDGTAPIGVRELATSANVGPATSARVVDLLDRDDLIIRGDRNSVAAVRKRSLARRWTDDYGLTSSNEIVSVVDPRGIGRTLTALQDRDMGYALTASAAVRPYLPPGVLPVAPLANLVMFTQDPSFLAQDLGLHRTTRGANVVLIRPFDPVVFTRAQRWEGLTYAAPSQVVADLLTGPGRSDQEAEQLMAALAVDDPGWER